jgi:hypothetical protein
MPAGRIVASEFGVDRRVGGAERYLVFVAKHTDTRDEN